MVLLLCKDFCFWWHLLVLSLGETLDSKDGWLGVEKQKFGSRKIPTDLCQTTQPYKYNVKVHRTKEHKISQYWSTFWFQTSLIFGEKTECFHQPKALQGTLSVFDVELYPVDPSPCESTAGHYSEVWGETFLGFHQWQMDWLRTCLIASISIWGWIGFRVRSPQTVRPSVIEKTCIQKPIILEQCCENP